MRNRTMLGAIAAALAILPAPALAQYGGTQVPAYGVEGRLSVTVKGGLETNWGGDVHEGGTGQVLGLPTEVGARSYNDVYDPGFRLGIGVGYGFTPSIEAIAAFSYGNLGAEEIEIGTVAGESLRGAFGDYKDMTFEGGLRWHFSPDAGFDPYVSGVIGFRMLDAIPLGMSVPAVGAVFDNVGFYNDSTVFMAGIDFGVQFKVGARGAFGIESGFRFQGSPEQVEGFAGTGLENLNDAGSRIAFPILATYTLYFD